MTEELQDQVKELEAEVKKLKAANKELKEQNRKVVSKLSGLQARTARAEAEASSLKKLLAHDGPHDPITKYD
jgi:SMC interacting uncharacterized protein involved in chromosome segregation